MRLLIVTLLALLVPASTAFADAFDHLKGDSELLGNDVDRVMELNHLEEVEEQAQEQDDLFPLQEGAQEEEEEFAGADVVTVRMNGIPVAFQDVLVSAWFAPYVRSALEKGIVSGYRDAEGVLLGLFGPADSVTIEQVAKMALQSINADVEGCEGELKNEAASESWSAQYILCAEQAGWAVYSDGGVDIYRPATRSEVVVTLLQAHGVALTKTTGEVFTDVGVSTQFSGAIERAAADGIVSGYHDDNGNPTGEFGPENPVQRAEIAKIVTNVLQVYGEY
jgi:hypothetical protein